MTISCKICKQLSNNKLKNIIWFVLIYQFVALISCEQEKITEIPVNENVVIVVMDGARYSETWGDSLKNFIPNIAGQMANKGVVYTNFYNNGPTSTTSGHTAITTGIYQEINNAGGEWPALPSIFHYFNLQYKQEITNSWIITSKDKLAVLAKCQYPLLMNLFSPSTNCGINGLGSGYRNDSLTYNSIIEILSTYHPKLVLINFMAPDFYGHSGNWNDYVNGIRTTDDYIFKIWQFLQNDSIYKGKTTFFVTNDHGRHLNGISDGFVSHGDTCEGCRHLFFFAGGPNIKEGDIIETKRELIDIPVTVAKILNIKPGNLNGQVMDEMFK